MRGSADGRGSDFLMKKQLRASVADGCRKIMLSKSTIEHVLGSATTGQLSFLGDVLAMELSSRDASRKARLIKHASFPVLKTFDGYDFSGVRFPGSFTKDQMLSLDFIADRKTIVFYGGCGSGKTHAMTALGLSACSRGYRTRFTTVSQLLTRLSEAKMNGCLEKMFEDIGKDDLLLLDELCYLPVDRESAQLLFRVISESYERKALVITTNLPFSEWGRLFTDEQLAAAIIDRIVHHGHLIATGERDWRLEHSLMKDNSQFVEKGGES